MATVRSNIMIIISTSKTNVGHKFQQTNYNANLSILIINVLGRLRGIRFEQSRVQFAWSS